MSKGRKRGFRQKIRRRRDFEVTHLPGQEIAANLHLKEELSWDRQQNVPTDPETALTVQCMLALMREDSTFWEESEYAKAVKQETEATLQEFLRERGGGPNPESRG